MKLTKVIKKLQKMKEKMEKEKKHFFLKDIKKVTIEYAEDINVILKDKNIKD